MTTYVDSSVLVAVYVPEQFSEAARRVIRTTPRVPFTPLHELEVPNAFALLRGRGLIGVAEHDAVHRQLRDDVDAQRLVQTPLDWDLVFASACELSQTYSSRLLSRSLDLLHVAAAQTALCRSFVSADDRQLAVAKAVGLKVIDIKRRVRVLKR